MTTRRVNVRALVLTTAASLTFVSVSLAGPKTTVPTKTVLVSVVIKDTGIILSAYRYTELGNGQYGYDPLPGPLPRGDYLKFLVLNLGKKTHNFTIFGKKTPPLKTGRKAHFNKLALVRGTFRYRSTLDRGKAFRGTLIIS
jgi:hypothetical protein